MYELLTKFQLSSRSGTNLEAIVPFLQGSDEEYKAWTCQLAPSDLRDMRRVHTHNVEHETGGTVSESDESICWSYLMKR